MRALLFISWLWGGALLQGQSSVIAQDADASPAPASIKEIAPGVFALDGVTFSKRDGTVKFPAVLNMNQGLLEYLLVNRTGKTHESLLATDLDPKTVHVAMLLIGAKGSPADVDKNAVPGQINAAYLKSAPDLKGDSISISLSWQSGGKRIEHPAEDLIFNEARKELMSRGRWIYNGSGFADGRFLASDEESMVALVTDPTALINNLRSGHNDDKIWTVNEKLAPAPETPVEVMIKLEKTGAARP